MRSAYVRALASQTIDGRFALCGVSSIMSMAVVCGLVGWLVGWLAGWSLLRVCARGQVSAVPRQHRLLPRDVPPGNAPQHVSVTQRSEGIHCQPHEGQLLPVRSNASIDWTARSLARSLARSRPRGRSTRVACSGAEHCFDRPIRKRVVLVDVVLRPCRVVVHFLL